MSFTGLFAPELPLWDLSLLRRAYRFESTILRHDTVLANREPGCTLANFHEQGRAPAGGKAVCEMRRWISARPC